MSNETVVKKIQRTSADGSGQKDCEGQAHSGGDGRIETEPDAQPRDIPSRRQHEPGENPKELDPRVHRYKEGDGPRG